MRCRRAGQRVPQAPGPRIASNIARNTLARLPGASVSEAREPAPQAPPNAARDASPARPQAAVGWTARALLAVFGWVTSAALRLLGATWRIEVLGLDPRSLAGPKPAHLAALLHQSLVVAAWHYRDAGYAIAVSRSRDGDLVAATLRALGYADPPRGSSSRGGSTALMGLVRQLEAGTTVAVLVDGPRGPAGAAKPGIAALARLADAPIQPVALAARPALRLSSWDQSLVPLPFARIVCAYGEPIAPDLSGDKAQDPACARAVERQLAALQDRAERHLARGAPRD